MRDESPPLPSGVLGRRILLTLLISIVVTGIGAQVMRTLAAKKEEPKQAEQRARAVAVRAVRLERVDYRESIDGYGSARALRRARVAAKIGGLVRWISPQLEAGNAVKEGDVLVRLDDRNAKSAMGSASARLDRHRADARKLTTELETARSKIAIVERELLASKRELERIESLQGQDAATASDYDKQSMATALRETALLDLEGRIRSLESQVERNKAESREAESELERARLDLERAEVRAPHGGRIESRRVHPGDHVAPGATLFELVDLSRVEIPVALAAMHFGSVGEKAAAELRLSGRSEVTWAGTVDRIGPTVSSEDRTFHVYLVVGQDSAGGMVPPGAFVTARIEGRRFDRVFVIPRSAMLEDRLYVARDGIARTVAPHIIARLPHAVLVDEGLREGEMLIASNLEEVADGTRVNLSTNQAVDAVSRDS